MTDGEKLRRLAELVKQMRAAQRAYFRERSKRLLRQSKELEDRVDREVFDITEGQRYLFPDSDVQ